MKTMRLNLTCWLLGFLITTQALAQYNQSLSDSKLIGTWKATNESTGRSFNFTMYANHKVYVYGQGATERWEKWYVEEGHVHYYPIDDGDMLYCVKPLYFDGHKFEYKVSTTGHYYTATKVSSTPQSPPKYSERRPSVASKKGGLDYLCGACLNTGERTCGHCYGRGGDGVGYCTPLLGSCGNGKIRCDVCFQRGLTSLEMLATAKASSPASSFMFGKWRANNGDIYIFYNVKADDVYPLEIVSDGTRFLSEWIIEDNVLKMRIIKPYNFFDKYTFASWNGQSARLINLDGSSILTLSH